MSRLLVVGWELPEFTPDQRMEAANYRTWQLTEGLRKDGHEVCLVAGRIGSEFTETPPRCRSERLAYNPIQFNSPTWIRRLQTICEEFDPDGIVGVTVHGSLRATRVKSRAPLWLDIYGDPLAEMQAKAGQVRSDRGIVTGLRFFRQLLRVGDAYSTCSQPQRFALIGQLATEGRLNRATLGYNLVHVLPPGAGTMTDVTPHQPIHGKLVDPDKPVVLWCGGYNTWTDVDTLFRGLDYAMGKNPDLHFVSVGGAAAGSNAYDRFADLIERSPNAPRFHLLGWKPVSEVPGYYRDADMGVSLDASCYEAELGTRTRLVEMMQHGLPIVTSRACELSYQIEECGLGRTFSIGDWQSLGRHLHELSERKNECQAVAERSRRYVRAQFSIGATTEPLRRWAARPMRAPDRQTGHASQVYSWGHQARSFARGLLWSVAGLDR